MIDKKLRVFEINKDISDLINREISLGIDITPLFKDMFGKNLLFKRAFFLCDNLNRNEAQIMADKIIANYNKSLQRKRKTIDFGAEEIYFELKDDSIFRLYSSEWGNLSKLN